MNTLSSLLKFIANSIAPIVSNQTAKKVLAAPNGAAGKPSFRELQASDITSGTLATARIPDLDASKINSGTFSANRIPNLPASKISSGTLPIARGGTGSTSSSTQSGSFTSSTGTVNTSSTIFKKWGNVVQATLVVRNSHNVSAGNNMYEGRLTTTALQPTISVRGVGMWNACNFIGSIDSSGNIEVRVFGNQLPSNTDVRISFTYLV